MPHLNPPQIGELFRVWPRSKAVLYHLGVQRVYEFCVTNDIPTPTIEAIPKDQWHVGACAYYRPQTIRICLDACANICNDAPGRNWNWPGSTTDREPYGVICHELGHHCDYLTGEHKWSYGSEYSEQVMKRSGESPITSYCPNPAEWFAEIFRLFVTNPDLLCQLRSKAYAILREKWKPVGSMDWKKVLGDNVPAKITRTLTNKGALPPIPQPSEVKP
jgi:hypothetical protein